MLVSILHGKAGRIPAEISLNTSWRDIMTISEDVLTGSVFSRLFYLEGPVLWEILHACFKLPSPQYNVAKLIEANFWPRWENATDDGLSIEPDIFFVFELGDPSKRVCFILEAKLGNGAGQYAEQWHREWQAYKIFASEGDLCAHECLFLAIGGLGPHPKARAKEIQKEANILGSEDLRAFGANWDQLSELSNELRKKAGLGSEAKRILADISSALALAGHRPTRSLQSVDPIGENWSPVNHFFQPTETWNA